VLFVEGCNTVLLASDEVEPARVGQKAVGLASLPSSWTLPFYCVSGELCRAYAAGQGQAEMLRSWGRTVREAAKKLGLRDQEEILVRSSGSSEGIGNRGRFYSAAGTVQNIETTLRICIEKLTDDPELRKDWIPLIIQKRCNPTKAKGHLSNERHCYEENRDWMGEFESADSDASAQFQINLRHWRRKLVQDVDRPLNCALSIHVSEALKEPADWAYRQRARVHFEWVWDGAVVYLVQADEELHIEGHDPIHDHKERRYTTIALTPAVLRLVDARDARRFSKIANVFSYLELGLPIAPLYILDDQRIIKALAAGRVDPRLRADVEELVKGSLVIRSDIATDEVVAKQLLPRTDELRDAETAFEWMVAQSKRLLTATSRCAFILHNFIPARAAAFAYATPDNPLVQVEALWGLPEGLYYNAHDKYVIDTVATAIDKVSPERAARFAVREKRNFKRFFVSPTPSGKWETLALRPPFDWRGSLSKQECRAIAFHSRRIAALEKRPLSIMWFVGVPSGIAASEAIPWYHERFDIAVTQRSITTRTKTVFDKSFVVRSAQDVVELEQNIEIAAPYNRIRVQPFDEKLLRDKNTLRNIGSLAKSHGAIIVLEGAVLSHAYYQLLETGAVVEVVHPFIGFEERHGYYKLVRDRVPSHIRERGETVTSASLDGEAFVKALREKLVEEAYEALDAKDLTSVIAELADVKEVLEALVQQLGQSAQDVEKQQIEKRRRLGGFEHGVVLVATESMPPTARVAVDDQRTLAGLNTETTTGPAIDEGELARRAHAIEKRTDRRRRAGTVEVRVNVVVPVTTDAWSAETSPERVEGTKGRIVTGRIRARRVGNHWNVEVSADIDETQLELF
jgi:predicted house-cleaning noncanonical NTP pyrophosphatase (MazG superfamily)